MIKDASYWAEEIKNKKISPIELLDETRKKADQDIYNSIVYTDYDKAYDQLKDWEYTGKLFDGVPILLKSLGHSYKDYPDNGSSLLLNGNRAKQTSNFVNSITDIGFIPFGQTNSPEFGFKNITDSKLYGDCTNVWDKERYSGGSSGGASSAVASGIVPLASSSDGGGSIRIPASWSGLIGLKPTRGRTAKGPNEYRSWQGAAVDFAQTVSVRDTVKFLLGTQVNQEENPFSPVLLNQDSLSNLKEPKKKLKIAFTTDSPFDSKISDDSKQAVMNMVKELEALGHKLEEVSYPTHGPEFIDYYYMMNAAETYAMFENSGLREDDIKAKVELLTYSLYEYGKNVTLPNYIKSLNSWDKATQIFNEKIFLQYDLFLTPTTADVAPKLTDRRASQETFESAENIKEYSRDEQAHIIYDIFARSLALTPYNYIVNLTGQAAITLPTYVTKENLPIGVQFMGSKNSEVTLLELALELENNGNFILPKYYR